MKLQHIALFILCSLFFSPALSNAQATAPFPAVATRSIPGKIDGVDIEAMVQSPSAENTPLQVACVFEYTDSDIYKAPALPTAANGMQHLNSGLNGIIEGLRKSGKFTGHAFETLLIDVPGRMIAPKKLLLIGLGDRKTFTPDIMKTVGSVGMREALRLGVTSYAHASDLKDGGLDSPTGLIIENVIGGAIDAYRTQILLKKNNMSSFKPIIKITLLAGQPFYEAACAAIKSTIVTYNK